MTFIHPFIFARRAAPAGALALLLAACQGASGALVDARDADADAGAPAGFDAGGAEAAALGAEGAASGAEAIAALAEAPGAATAPGAGDAAPSAPVGRQRAEAPAAAPEFGPDDAPGALALTGKRSRGSNSQLPLPADRVLADVNADGVADFARYAGTRIVVNATDFALTPVLQLDVGRPVRRLITGDFHGDRYDQVCAVLDDGSMPCYGISGDRRALWWWFTQGSIAAANEDTIVGDYDADGRDDVLVYNRASGAIRMYSMKGAYFLEAMPRFALGNLSGAAVPGMRFRAGDFNGDGRDDLMAINGAGQLISYFGVDDGVNHTFWWAFTSAGGFVGPDDQITSARVDDNLGDDIVLRNKRTGQTRFHRMEFGGGSPPALTTVGTGQINLDGESLIAFAPLRGTLPEPGGARRDDAMVFLLGPVGGLVRSDARWSGSAHTYWWAYSQYENPLPVSVYAQETSMWCWAASAQMAMGYLGRDVPQCDQANRRFGRSDCCANPTSAACAQGGWPDFDGYGFNSNRTAGTALSFAALDGQIQAQGRPVAFSWAWTGGGGHMMVATGTRAVGGQNWVTMNDPWAPLWGDQRDVLYSAYVSGPGYTHWDDFYNIVRR